MSLWAKKQFRKIEGEITSAKTRIMDGSKGIRISTVTSGIPKK